MDIHRRRISQFLAGAASGLLLPDMSMAEYLPACMVSRKNLKVMDIDVHCHAFNGSDLQVGAFIRRVYAPDFDGVERKLLELLAEFIQGVLWEVAPRGEHERGRLERFGSGDALSAESKRSEALVREDEQRSQEVYGKYLGDALKSGAGREFLNQYLDYVHARVEADPSVKWWIDAKDRRSELEILSDSRGLMRQLEFEHKNNVFQVFTFIKTFFNYRYLNIHYLLRTYGCDQGTVQLIAPALVDFDYGLGAQGSSPPTGLKEQFLVMERISELFGGRVLTYLPYDPWRHAIEGPGLLHTALDFIRKGAAVGFKLYPPMGFAPSDNVAVKPRPPQWPSAGDFPRKLDASLKEFWDEVQKRDIPVITHGNPSNQATHEFQRLGSPRNWEQLLSKKGYERLRVCFGHFGGQKLLSAPDAWPAEYLKLTERFENVYGDISYFDDILLTTPGRDLQNRLSKFIKATPMAEKKTIYGSDWSMIALKARSDTYFKRFDIALKRPSLFGASVRNNVMAHNAARFLGLNKGAATRNRLTAFYGAKGIKAAWPSLIDWE